MKMIDLILILLFIAVILLYEYVNNKQSISLEGENIKSFFLDLLFSLIITLLAAISFIIVFNLIKNIL
jgi:hypothetical protein